MSRGSVAWRSSVDHDNPASRPAQYESRIQAGRSAADHHYVIDAFLHTPTVHERMAFDKVCCCFWESAASVTAMKSSPANTMVLAEVGSRLKRARAQRGVTLTVLAAETGISKSTLSRLESGQRKASLELLLPIAQAHQVSLDKLVGTPEVGDPRVGFTPRVRNGRIVFPLTRQPGRLHAWKVIIPPEPNEPELRTHNGYEWLFVLSGQMRLILGEHDITLGPGEVAEFDTRLPHWFGPAADEPIEILSLHGRQGERMQVRAAPRREVNDA